MKKLGGVKAPHHKHTAAQAPERIPVPAEVRLPMSMHSGTPANPVVAVGEFVRVGQMIGEATGSVSSPVHASVSGTIKSIDDYNSLTGQKAVTIAITSDGNQIPYDQLSPRAVHTLAEFLQAVNDSGVVGLGGAGYPTAPKITLDASIKIDYVLINGAECEPYITSDTRTMVDKTEYVWEGAKLIKEYLRAGKVIICIENNKPEPIRKLQALCAGITGIEVCVLPSLYPQGERKVLVYNVTGRIVPEGGRLHDVGCMVMNCTTISTIAEFIQTGMPLVSKCVTVDGSAVERPTNLLAPIGTPVRDLLDYCGLKEDARKIIMGGPMMGTAIPDLDIPIVKVTNAVLALSAKDAEPPRPTACIKCGRCIRMCPMHMTPPSIETAYMMKKPELLQAYKVGLCAECGCCAYSCPAKRPLAQVMTLSKKMLRSYTNAQRAAAAAKAAKAAEAAQTTQAAQAAPATQAAPANKEA